MQGISKPIRISLLEQIVRWRVREMRGKDLSIGWILAGMFGNITYIATLAWVLYLAIQNEINWQVTITNIVFLAIFAEILAYASTLQYMVLTVSTAIIAPLLLAFAYEMSIAPAWGLEATITHTCVLFAAYTIATAMIALGMCIEDDRPYLACIRDLATMVILAPVHIAFRMIDLIVLINDHAEQASHSKNA